jgi:hypothetical protein
MKSPDRNTVSKLDALPNIGKAISADLAKINITHPKQLIGQDAYELHASLCQELGFHQDNCVIDVFLSAIQYMEGGEALPWWYFTEERKRKLSCGS